MACCAPSPIPTTRRRGCSIAPSPGRWGGAPPAPEDLDYLAERAKGLSVAGMDGGQVAEIVKAIRQRYRDKRSSWNQARCLIRAGLDPEVDFATASAVSRFLK